MGNLFFWLFTFREAVLLALLSLLDTPPSHTTTLTKPIYAMLPVKVCKLFFEVRIFSYFQLAVTFLERHAAEHLRLRYSRSQASGTQKKRHDAAILSVQNDLPLSCTFIMKMAHHNLLHFTGNRYNTHRPYAKQHKLTTTCGQAPLRDGDDGASEYSDGSACAAYVVSVSCDYNVQSWFPLSLSFGFFFAPFPCIFPSSQALVIFCSLLYSCWGTDEREENIKGRTLFVAFFADNAGPFST